MLKENQIIKVRRITGFTNYDDILNGKGYEVKEDNSYYISPEDLPPGSHKRVIIICDMCKKELGMEYRQYLRKSKEYGDGKYYCKFCAAKTDEVKQKRKQGMLSKYGVENPMENPILKRKCMESSLKNGSVPTSKAQLKVFDMLKEKYDNVFLNYLVENMYVDCVVFQDSSKIAIEYDGWYWHQDSKKDEIRDARLIELGFKVLRIKGGKKPPSKEELIDNVEILLKEDNNKLEIILPDYKQNTN